MALNERSHDTLHVRVDRATVDYLKVRAAAEGRLVSSLVWLILKREREAAERETGALNAVGDQNGRAPAGLGAEGGDAEG